jgi:hypothetical protein
LSKTKATRQDGNTQPPGGTIAHRRARSASTKLPAPGSYRIHLTARTTDGQTATDNAALTIKTKKRRR